MVEFVSDQISHHDVINATRMASSARLRQMKTGGRDSQNKTNATNADKQTTFADDLNLTLGAIGVNRRAEFALSCAMTTNYQDGQTHIYHQRENAMHAPEIGADATLQKTPIHAGAAR